jgi:Mce-associated membrane protein
VGTPDKEVAVPSFRRRASATDTERVEEPPKTPDGTADDALTLAEEAEAEAAEAEAMAAAARARARAIRLRREAKAAEIKPEPATQADVTTPDETAPAAAEGDDVADVEPADAEAADEPVLDAGDDEEHASSGRRWGLVVKIVAMTLAVLCTSALIAASVIMVREHRAATEEQNRNAEFLAAGRQSVVTLMSLDFNNAQEDVKRIIENSTGTFKKDFEDQAEDFVKVAQSSKVITDVTVTAAAVDKMTADTATVLVAATSRVTNSAGAKQEPRAWRLSVDLQRDGGQIKMAKVEFVP